jgi:sulfide:quinone oxidoreductase
MGVAGPEVSAAVRGMVVQKRIAYRPEHQVARAEPQRLHFTDGQTLDFDLLVYVPPLRPPPALAASGLADASGWVRVDRSTLATSFPDVYAVGDVTLIPLAMGKPLPRAGVFAHAQAEVVAENIARIIAREQPSARFDGHGSCFIETGRGKAGYGAGNFYAEPRPQVRVRRPGRIWHWGKALFEKQFLWQSI